jgi:MFS-type transporter involved in bile tolerance (Atg22 family)
VNVPLPAPTLPPQPAVVVVENRSGLSTAAMTCGIIGACLGLIPILGIVAFPLGILAVIFGIVGIRRKARKGFAITGLVTGLLALLFAVIGIVVVNNAVDNFKACTNAVSADIHDGTHTADTVCGK